MKNKTLTLLGFAAKAGKLSFGMSKTLEALKSNKSEIIVCAENISEKSKKEISFFSHNKSIDLFILNEITIEMLSAAVGRQCGIISVNDNNFATAISKILGGNANDQQI